MVSGVERGSETSGVVGGVLGEEGEKGACWDGDGPWEQGGGQEEGRWARRRQKYGYASCDSQCSRRRRRFVCVSTTTSRSHHRIITTTTHTSNHHPTTFDNHRGRCRRRLTFLNFVIRCNYRADFLTTDPSTYTSAHDPTASRHRHRTTLPLHDVCWPYARSLHLPSYPCPPSQQALHHRRALQHFSLVFFKLTRLTSALTATYRPYNRRPRRLRPLRQ